MSHAQQDFREAERALETEDRKMMARRAIMVGVLILSPTLCVAASVNNIVLDDASVDAMRSIQQEAAKHAIYSYNIANASTPGFKPLRIKEDGEKTGGILAQELEDDVNIDMELAKLTKSRLRHAALNRFLSTKVNITKRVISMGKGGQ